MKLLLDLSSRSTVESTVSWLCKPALDNKEFFSYLSDKLANEHGSPHERERSAWNRRGAPNVALPASERDERSVAEARSRSDRSASPVAASRGVGPFEDRGRPRSAATVKRLFRSPQGRRQPVAVDEARDTNTARNTFEPPDARAGDVADDTEDVDMGQGDGFLQNAPALPKNPTFKGSTKEERRPFMSAYNLYISQTNALTANGVRPFVMPVGACIDPVTKQRVAEWDMGKDPDDVTEGEWIEWFKLAYDVDPRALDGLKKRIAAAVVFDMSITDADSRIGQDGMSAAIRRDRQEWVLREESPAIVKIITAAIKPASLQRAVTEQMDLSRNKPLKKDVYRFVRWLREYAVGHERFVGYEEEKPVAKQAVKFESGKTARARVENKPTSSQPQKVAFAPGASARASPMGCLKCKSPDHRVRDCPDVTKDEAVALLKGHTNALAVERTRGASKGSAAVKRVAKVESVPREDLACTVEGILPVRASLLDSGADISVASGGLVSALIAAGAAVDLTSTVPVSLQPYGAESSRICVTKQVRLRSLEFKTAFGPLLLRGLRVWVDETVSDVELTLGLPVMKKLGYNDQTLLENARRQQAVWDFGDQPTSTPGVAMHRALRVEERADDIDDDEGMCCATPELRAPDGADDKAIVREILLSKVDDACAEGMAPEDAERLTSVLLEFQDVFRVRFGQDPPVKVAPLKVHLKAGAVPA
ncbi:unnamed protein product, partial [Aphanomyces euteiches]